MTFRSASKFMISCSSMLGIQFKRSVASIWVIPCRAIFSETPSDTRLGDYLRTTQFGRQKMTRDDFFKHLKYLDRSFEIQPPPQGIVSNKFTVCNFDGNHIIIKTERIQAELFLPFGLIDAICAGILTLTKVVRVAGKSLAWIDSSSFVPSNTIHWPRGKINADRPNCYGRTHKGHIILVTKNR